MSPFQKYSETKFTTTTKKERRIDWATSAYISATFLSSKKKEKCSPLLWDVMVYQPLKCRLWLFTRCEPAFLSQDMRLQSSETVHTDVYKTGESSSRTMAKPSDPKKAHECSRDGCTFCSLRAHQPFLLDVPCEEEIS